MGASDIAGQAITIAVSMLFAVVGAVFLVAGTVLLFLGIASIVQALSIRGWPKTHGLVKSATVAQARRPRVGPAGRPRISYEYKVDGRTYESDRVAFSMTSTPRAVEKTMRRYTPGALVEVYYDPRQPERSVLEKPWGVVGTVVLLVCGAILAGAGFFAGRAALEVMAG
jgi:hypothetical protein